MVEAPPTMLTQKYYALDFTIFENETLPQNQ